VIRSPSWKLPRSGFRLTATSPASPECPRLPPFADQTGRNTDIARSAADAPNGLGITEGDFKVVTDHLTDVLNEFKVPEKEQAELMDVIATLHDDIVDRPDEMGLSKDVPIKR
jgi:hypothetical protein